MAVRPELGLEAMPVPGRSGLLPEELAAHVVVDADDVQPLVGEEPGGLGSDQTSRTSNYSNGHSTRLVILVLLRALGDVRRASQRPRPICRLSSGEDTTQLPPQPPCCP